VERLLLRQVLLRGIGLPCVVKNSIGSIRFNETDRSTFAVSSLWGKFGGLYACGATFPHTVPLPNIFVTHLFSKQTLKRKDFQEIVRLTWAQEVWSSNLHAPTKSFSIRKLRNPNFGTAALWCNVGTIRKIPEAKPHAKLRLNN
jgi:hypothetical protein